MSATQSTEGVSSMPEYQHYVPQFLLRNFSHRFGKRNQKKKLHPNNKVLNVLDLSHDDPTLSVQRVDRTFGRYDMYCDSTALDHDQKRRIKTELGRLENDVAPVFAKLLDAQSNSDKLSCDGYTKLSQHEQFLLKRFIFVMKYRSQIFFRRYNHENKEDYNDKDKAKMLKYMEERNFHRPIDVWFDNLWHMMVHKFEGEMEWCKALEKLIYPEDALWLQLSMRLKYPVVCTPQNHNEEFVVTGDAYCLHEGPSDSDSAAELYTICIVAPRLAILMRDDALPELMDDQDPERQEMNREMLAAQLSKLRFPENATSILETLRVVKPRSTYTTNSDGQLIFSWSHPWVEVKAKVLYFPIFRISSEHVQNINSVILNEAYDLPEIVFRSKSALLLALQAFLPMPSEGFYSLKNYPSEGHDRVLYLKKLERFAHSEGLDIKAVYKLPKTHMISVPVALHREEGGLHDYPLPRAQHTADMPSPFRPENEHLFESNYSRQMAPRGETPALEDLMALFTMTN
ncbi:hypothetical protein E8E13_010097 [Curvularia kusanoi]|uniref:DUF4238 domain-containing protein n=1 Tax=Curvularia kusanoi TaxID=90978 RepID=A0A9P4THT5_CURKU|nr:hypothetical protein E8E13_010097 [Curvularia kusanoi]